MAKEVKKSDDLAKAKKAGTVKDETPKAVEKNESIAVIKTGGKQYKVKAGDVLKIEKIDQEAGIKIEFDDILNGAKVTAEIVAAGKLPKVMVSKFHSKKRYERHVGHRQNFTQIKIEAINVR